MFWDATHKREEGNEFSFFINIGRAVAGDYCCSVVAIKSSYYHPWLYSLYAIK